MQYAFEDYVIDSDRRELTHSAELIAVGPQVFDLLLHLVRNREHVVSKDELLAAVWAGRIVSELTLTSHINAARKAIGDSGQNQRLLRTIARKGFRFVGDVSEIASRSAAVSTEPDAPGKTIGEAPALPDRPSIAALPFLNLSGDIEQEYFTDGVVEDIITSLSRNRWLFVIARNSSFTYKGRAVDVKQVGRELGVRYVLEGSVRKAAHKVRITGQLIDATTGAHLWAERFESALDDIFELQDQVTEAVVGAIAPQLERAEIERAKRKPTESLDAYDYYLRGMAHLHLGSRESIDAALGQFNHALMRDPNFASGYAMAAWCYFWRKVNGWMTDRPGEIAEGARLARRAVDLGRDDAVALTRGGHALAHLTDDVAGGIALLDRAGARAQSQSRVGLVPRRISANMERRAGRRHRALRARHEAQPTRPRALPHAGRTGGGASVRGALRRRVVVGGESLPGVAELPDGRQCHRGEPCAGGQAGRGAARDEASARARPHAARLQSRGLAPDPPAGGPRDLRGWVAEGGAAGVRRAVLRPIM